MDPAWEQLSILDRMVVAVERVRDRLLRAATALEAAGIPYAVTGGNAVAAWVATIDAAAVRNTQDVDILLRRRIWRPLHERWRQRGLCIGMWPEWRFFLDGAQAKAGCGACRDGGGKVRPEYAARKPDVSESAKQEKFQVVARWRRLVRMKLTSFRDKDKTHLRDMLDIGLIDATWVGRFAPELGGRLQQLIDTPES